MADEAERDVVEQAHHPGVLEEAAEQDEQEDVGCRHQHRDAEDALGAEEELVDDLVEAVAAVGEGTRKVLAEQAVGEEGGTDDRQRDADDRRAASNTSTMNTVPTTRSAVLGSPERWMSSASNTR